MKNTSTHSQAIDLNADLGEGSPYDEAILAIVSSANISCGAHAGDDTAINDAIRFAKKYDVVIGAHPSYPDRENMGRKSLAISLSSLADSVFEQLNHIDQLAKDSGAELRYVKAHGALYNDMAGDEKLARNFCQWVIDFNASLAVMGLAGSAVARACNAMNIPFIAEAFIDRRYQADGTLVSRSQAGATIRDSATAVKQALQLIEDQSVTTLEGQTITVQADSLCLHGDSPEALVIAKQLRSALAENHIAIKATR
ncbi:MAG: 5-oxoprolinase subunit PxpA [Pseudohongiella nitratireducens]|nr:5-oxoprolinase subunit PxpA [Pseudohongiella nitratireducens]MDF1623333.1 5-oxoprolinase subunit PxpA [Pseudohongiella nitratireducens]